MVKKIAISVAASVVAMLVFELVILPAIQPKKTKLGVLV